MGVKKVKITPQEYQRCMRCEERNKNVEGVIKCMRVKCIHEVKK